MITAFSLWLDLNNNKTCDDIYIGTVIIDLFGIVTTGIVIDTIITSC